MTLVERLAERKRQLRAMNLARPPSPATDLARALEEDQRRAGRRQALRAAGLPDADTADRIREREWDVPRPRARLLPPESDPTAAPTTSLAATDPGAPSPPPGADAEMVSAGTPGPGTDAGTPEAPLVPADFAPLLDEWDRSFRNSLESSMTAIPMCSDCGKKPAYCRGLCHNCYDRHRRQHDLDQVAPPPKTTGRPRRPPAPVVDECPQWGPDPTADAGPPTPPAPTVEELRERALVREVDVWPLVMEDMLRRRREGISRYGRPLTPHNGRNGLRDAYEEALDLCAYLRQVLEEGVGA